MRTTALFHGKHSKKRLVAAVLAVLFIFALTGCAKNPQQTETEPGFTLSPAENTETYIQNSDTEEISHLLPEGVRDGRSGVVQITLDVDGTVYADGDSMPYRFSNETTTIWTTDPVTSYSETKTNDIQVFETKTVSVLRDSVVSSYSKTYTDGRPTGEQADEHNKLFDYNSLKSAIWEMNWDSIVDTSADTKTLTSVLMGQEGSSIIRMLFTVGTSTPMVNEELSFDDVTMTVEISKTDNLLNCITIDLIPAFEDRMGAGTNLTFDLTKMELRADFVSYGGQEPANYEVFAGQAPPDPIWASLGIIADDGTEIRMGDTPRQLESYGWYTTDIWNEGETSVPTGERSVELLELNNNRSALSVMACVKNQEDRISLPPEECAIWNLQVSALYGGSFTILGGPSSGMTLDQIYEMIGEAEEDCVYYDELGQYTSVLYYDETGQYFMELWVYDVSGLMNVEFYDYTQ